LKARRRVATAAAVALGIALTAARPGHAETPAPDLNCRKAGNDVKDAAVPTSVGSPRGGLLSLTNSLNGVLTNNDILNLVPIDEVNIDNVRLIENVNILSKATSASAPCR
jgi:hypothetical protein